MNHTQIHQTTPNPPTLFRIDTLHVLGVNFQTLAICTTLYVRGIPCTYTLPPTGLGRSFSFSNYSIPTSPRTKLNLVLDLDVAFSSH